MKIDTMKHVARRRLILCAMACASAALLASCRDGVEPFTAVQSQQTPDSPKQLTFSDGLDLNPTWSAGSDTVYYSSAKFIDLQPAPNSLLRIARNGGITQLLTPDVDPTRSNALVLPVLAPTHDRIAYVRLGFFDTPANCSLSAAAVLANCLGTEPLLDTAYLRVRPVVSTQPTSSDPSIGMQMEGVDPARSRGLPGPYLQHVFPYQKAFSTSHELLFRPSWSPDGQQLVFSDGLKLHLWTPSQVDAPVIANTADGVSPAWSPSGNTIAFVRMSRDDSTFIQCSCYEGDGPPPTSTPIPRHNRWFYHVSHSIITLINADGTGATDVTEGHEPAWSPDGNTLYFTLDANIYRVPRTGGAPVLIPGTQFGRSPAVSPDGKWLAFAKYSTDDTNADIWVIRLDQQ